jgi:hypothetical protein
MFMLTKLNKLISAVINILSFFIIGLFFVFSIDLIFNLLGNNHSTEKLAAEITRILDHFYRLNY